MKRKFLSMFMALTMALTLIPTTAFATDEPASTTHIHSLYEVIATPSTETLDDRFDNAPASTFQQDGLKVVFEKESGYPYDANGDNYAQVYHPEGTLEIRR